MSLKISDKHKTNLNQLVPPPRVLCGPGPCNVDPRVLAAMSQPLVGHLDPYFISLMNEIQELLRYTWQTENAFTIPVSGTGSASMEACLANIVEHGDVVLIGQNGYFGLRLADMAERLGAKVVTIKKPWGQVFTFDEIKSAVEEHKPTILGLVHAETSTGALQPVEGIGELCHKNNCLFLLDTVTSIAGAPLFVDEWGVDMCYAGGQKCLSCPPGISPLSFSARAMEKLKNRKNKVPNWYLDMTMLANYWGTGKRTYHHTAPISMNYAIREALRAVAEEGLESRWNRHKQNAETLYKGLEELGLTCTVAKEYRIPALTTVNVPEGIDPAVVCKHVLDKYNIEIGAGLGELAGKVWRIGLMGFNSRPEVVLLVLAALKDALQAQGFSKK